MTFIPKHAVLEALARPRLTELARALGITPARSRRELLVQLGMLPDHRFRDLLALLQAPELRAIARAHHLADLRDGDALADCVALGADSESDPPPRRKPAPPPPPPVPTTIPENDDDLPANVTRLRRTKPTGPERRGGELDFEATLWQAADKLRNNMDAAEYKHVVLGLLFLKYISDAFERHRDQLHQAGSDSDDPALYAAARVFWVPPAARWRAIAMRAESP